MTTTTSTQPVVSIETSHNTNHGIPPSPTTSSSAVGVPQTQEIIIPSTLTTSSPVASLQLINDLQTLSGAELDPTELAKLEAQLTEIAKKDKNGEEAVSQCAKVFSLIADVAARDDKAYDQFIAQYTKALQDTSLDRCFVDPILDKVRVPEFDRLIHTREVEVQQQATVEGGRRYNFPPHIAEVLKAWLIEHQDRPYPNDEEKHALAQETNLTVEQIKYWFINARRRLLPKIKQEKGSTKQLGGNHTSSASMSEQTHMPPPYNNNNVIDMMQQQQSQTSSLHAQLVGQPGPPQLQQFLQQPQPMQGIVTTHMNSQLMSQQLPTDSPTASTTTTQQQQLTMPQQHQQAHHDVVIPQTHLPFMYAQHIETATIVPQHHQQQHQHQHQQQQLAPARKSKNDDGTEPKRKRKRST